MTFVKFFVFRDSLISTIASISEHSLTSFNLILSIFMQKLPTLRLAVLSSIVSTGLLNHLHADAQVEANRSREEQSQTQEATPSKSEQDSKIQQRKIKPLMLANCKK